MKRLALRKMIACGITLLIASASLMIWLISVEAGAKFQINTTTTDSQDTPDVASLPDGRLIAVWESDSAPPGDADIGARVMNTDGTPATSELLITDPGNGFWRNVSVVATGANRFVIVWMQFNPNAPFDTQILGTVVTVSGNTLTNGAILHLSDETTADDNEQPQAAALPNGNVIIAWGHANADFTNSRLTVRTYTPNLVPISPETAIGTAIVNQLVINPAISTNGTHVDVVWNTGGPGNVFARSFSVNADGTIPSITPGQTQINGVVGGAIPGFGTLPNGDILVVYTSGNDLLGRVYQMGFVNPGPAFQIDTSAEAFQPGLAQVAVLLSGGYMIVWQQPSKNPDNTDNVELYVRLFDETGQARTNQLLVNPISPNTFEQRPQIVPGATGGVEIVWQESLRVTSDQRDIYGKIFENIGPTATGTDETLAAILEDATNPSGTQLAGLLGDQYDDLDNNPLSGVAFVSNAATPGQGAWQHSTNGVSWTTIAANVSDANATLVAPTSLVRFLPAANFNGTTPPLSVRLWDGHGAFTVGTTGVNISGAIFDENPNGGTLENPFTGNLIAIKQSVTAVNDAPTAGTGPASLTAINEDTANPPAQAVSSFITGSLFSDALDQIAPNPPDGSNANTLAGIAIITNATSALEGSWQYSTNGTVWTTIGTPSSTSALIVEANHFLRFVPALNFNGLAPLLGAHVIDNSGASGALSTGSTRNLTGATGGTTAISANSVGITQTINAVNDAPVLTGVGPGFTYVENDPATLLDTNAAVSDVDLDAFNSSAGNYTGASLMIARNGGANAQDLLALSTTGALFTINANALQSGGQTFATFTSSGGTLTLSFTGSGTIPTRALVQDVLRHITYANSSDAPPASVQLDYTFNDGNTGGGQGSGGALTATGNTTITITAVNDAPVNTVPGAQMVNEDTNLAISGLSVSDVDALPASDAITLTLTVSNGTLDVRTDVAGGLTGGNVSGDNTNSLTLTGTQNAINATLAAANGLTYRGTQDFNGSDTLTVTANDQGNTGIPGAQQDQDTVAITVLSVNDAPTLASITPNPTTLLEDAAAQTVNLSGITAGAANESSQTLTLTAMSDNPLLIPNPTVTYTSPNATGSLSYTPVANANGSAIITVMVTDSGGMANGGVATFSRTFTINVTAVNDVPSFTKGADQFVPAAAGAQTVNGWAINLSAGPADESGQMLTFIVSNDNNALFAVQPTINASGTLTYTPTINGNGIATVTVRLMDNGGTANGGQDTSAAQTFLIAVCTLTCPANVTQANDVGQCGAIINYAVPPSGGCGMIACTPPTGTLFPKGITTVTCTASVGSPMPACSFTVTVTDTQPPAVTCPSPIVVNTQGSACSAAVTFTGLSATDNCDGALTPVCTPPSGSTFQKGVTTVNCTASDTSGNSAPCSFTVTVNDTQAPIFDGCTNRSANVAPGSCAASLTFTGLMATDNCDGARTVTCTPPSGSSFPKGVTTVSCLASDTMNNTAMCSFTVTITDNIPPALTCPGNMVITTATNLCAATVSYANATASDNCPGVGVPSCTPPSGSSFPKGVTTVSCTVQDAAGNNAGCSFTVTVNDAQPPSISCPPTVNAPPGVVTYPSPVVSDNCPGVGSPVCNPASGSVFGVGTMTVNCTVQDAAGNSAACSFLVTTFDVCLQDDSQPLNKLFFLSTTGDYLFCCADGTQVIGRGTVTRKGSTYTLSHTGNGVRVQASVTLGSINRGTANLQKPIGTQKCAITDSNTTNNECMCRTASANATK